MPDGTHGKLCLDVFEVLPFPRLLLGTTSWNLKYSYGKHLNINAGKLLERTMMQKYGVENATDHFMSFNTICDATQVGKFSEGPCCSDNVEDSVFH